MDEWVIRSYIAFLFHSLLDPRAKISIALSHSVCLWVSEWVCVSTYKYWSRSSFHLSLPRINLHKCARQHNYQSILCFMNHDILFVMQCGAWFIKYFWICQHLNLDGKFFEREETVRVAAFQWSEQCGAAFPRSRNLDLLFEDFIRFRNITRTARMHWMIGLPHNASIEPTVGLILNFRTFLPTRCRIFKWVETRQIFIKNRILSW